MLTTLVLLVFPLLMAFAASSDLLTMRISNRLVLILVVGFFIIALVIRLPIDQLGLHVACATLVLIVAFSFFSFGWIGGGDAKLMAATTLWLGFGMMLPYIVYASILGGALTIALLSVRKFPLPLMLTRVGWIARLHDKNNGVPYGIALAAAGLLTYSDTTIFHAFAG
jgi:prepilin peptidase CpaA